MKKIINEPTQVVDEMLQGLSFMHDDLVQRLDGFDVIVRKAEKTGKVGLISGGGSGHEPSHAGFVGDGMLSAAICGAVFTSPTPDQILEAIKSADEGAGVFMVIKNYSGDIMNFEIAQELAEMEGIDVASVVVDDDIAVENSLYTQGRRGVAGTILVHKILGAAARSGKSLSEGFQLKAGERYGLLINGLGSTPLMEQYVFANDVAKLLREKGVDLAFKKIGNYMTSIDMAGLSLTLIRLVDDEWLDALNAPVTTPAW